MRPQAQRPAPLAQVAGRVAFITDESSGVGLGLARACRQAGMRVAFTWRRAAEQVECAFGLVHLLACNAGVGIRAAAAEATFKDWNRGLGVNLGGVVNGIATLLPRMRTHGEGAHLLATCSTSGLAAGVAGP